MGAAVAGNEAVMPWNNSPEVEVTHSSWSPSQCAAAADYAAVIACATNYMADTDKMPAGGYAYYGVIYQLPAKRARYFCEVLEQNCDTISQILALGSLQAQRNVACCTTARLHDNEVHTVCANAGRFYTTRYHCK